MADTLETLAHLALWTDKDPAEVEADPRAQFIMEKADELVISAAGIPATWTTDATLVPARARTISLLVAARTYTNWRSIVAQGVGPISETMLAEMAAAMQLTEAEASELEQMRQEAGDSFGGLWTITTTRGEEPKIDQIALPDSSGSDWLIPYGNSWETDALNPEVS
jgi:hypothetical protein